MFSQTKRKPFKNHQEVPGATWQRNRFNLDGVGDWRIIIEDKLNTSKLTSTMYKQIAISYTHVVVKFVIPHTLWPN